MLREKDVGKWKMKVKPRRRLERYSFTSISSLVILEQRSFDQRKYVEQKSRDDEILKGAQRFVLVKRSCEKLTLKLFVFSGLSFIY